MNIKSSLTLKFTTIVAAIILGLSIFTYQFSVIFRKNGFTYRLRSVSEAVVANYLDEPTLTPEILKLLYQKQLNRFPNERLIIADEKYHVVFASHAPTSIEVGLLERLYKSKEDIELNRGDTDYVAYVTKHGTRSFFVSSSAVDVTGHEKLTFLKYILIILTTASIILAALSGWNFSRNALEPIKEVVVQVAKINEKSLHQRVNEGNGKDEIAQLATTFNKMLERIENSFMVQKLFVANASHEFRTPLTAMKGQIEVLLLQDRPKEEYIKVFQSLLEDIDNQIGLINSLSELAKANADFPNISFGEVSMAEVLMESREELLRRKPQYKIMLEFGTVPEDERLLEVKGDFALLKSVFTNLMDNACKFSNDNSCVVRVSFGESVIEVAVVDNGVGIAKKDLPNVFEPFFRSNETRMVHGYGIGLSLVKKTIEVHKGKIEIASGQGKGTVVLIQLNNLTFTEEEENEEST